MLCCQLAAPTMAARDSIGERALRKIAGTSYVASKAALAGLARSVVAPKDIMFNTEALGRILTETASPPDRTAPVTRPALSRLSSGRLGRPQDVGGEPAFLASDQASFVNDAITDANGGEFVAVGSLPIT
ncbi:SDR family oxidoreductase [Sinorhizobium garamanticum]